MNPKLTDIAMEIRNVTYMISTPMYKPIIPKLTETYYTLAEQYQQAEEEQDQEGLNLEKYLKEGY
ncbi:MAG: hypothetical protein U9O94_08315 [Nanoarchaeota archaeon]|nr:hypothetical protein [Nanoarchaeota archaeon]